MTYMFSILSSLKSTNSEVTPLHSLSNQFYPPTQLLCQRMTASSHLKLSSAAVLS